MTREYNNPNNNRNRNRAPRQHSRDSRRDSRDYRNQRNQQNQGKKYNKSMIFLKSTVYSLGIVLAVLLIAFFIIKNNKDSLKNANIAKCEQRPIQINGKIDEVSVSKSEIVILTENKKGDQELIRLDKDCLNELSRRKF